MTSWFENRVVCHTDICRVNLDETEEKLCCASPNVATIFFSNHLRKRQIPSSRVSRA